MYQKLEIREVKGGFILTKIPLTDFSPPESVEVFTKLSTLLKEVKNTLQPSNDEAEKSGE